MPYYIKIQCPHCKNDEVTKAGFTAQGKQRYQCRHKDCETKTFLNNYHYKGDHPEIKEHIIDRAINGSGIRDTARVLKMSQWFVMEALKKRPIN
jgi:transposase-like protein